MGYQSEAALENQVMEQLGRQGFENVKLYSIEAIIDNFRKILNNNDLLIVLFLREGEEDKREKAESKEIINLLAWLKNVEQKDW